MTTLRTRGDPGEGGGRRRTGPTTSPGSPPKSPANRWPSRRGVADGPESVPLGSRRGAASLRALIPSRLPGRRIDVTYQPLGVVGVITAWNFPVYNQTRAISSALAAGCSGQPSIGVHTCSAMLVAHALTEAGLPEGVLNVINGDPESMGQVMLDDKRLKKIQFTGSTRVGRLLMDGAPRTVTVSP